MAQPARRIAAPEEPPVDPEAVDRAYHYHRARRNARLRKKREKSRARLRFTVTLGVLVALDQGAELGCASQEGTVQQVRGWLCW